MFKCNTTVPLWSFCFDLGLHDLGSIQIVIFLIKFQFEMQLKENSNLKCIFVGLKVCDLYGYKIIIIIIIMTKIKLNKNIKITK